MDADYSVQDLQDKLSAGHGPDIFNAFSFLFLLEHKEIQGVSSNCEYASVKHVRYITISGNLYTVSRQAGEAHVNAGWQISIQSSNNKCVTIDGT